MKTQTEVGRGGNNMKLVGTATQKNRGDNNMDNPKQGCSCTCPLSCGTILVLAALGCIIYLLTQRM